MNRYLSALAVAALMAGGACSRNNGKPADSALNTDLSLAAQQKTSLDSISAVERGNALTTAPAATPAPVTRTSSGEVSHTATTHRSTSTAHRSSGSSSGASSSGSSTERPRAWSVLPWIACTSGAWPRLPSPRPQVVCSAHSTSTASLFWPSSWRTPVANSTRRRRTASSRRPGLARPGARPRRSPRRGSGGSRAPRRRPAACARPSWSTAC